MAGCRAAPGQFFLCLCQLVITDPAVTFERLVPTPLHALQNCQQFGSGLRITFPACRIEQVLDVIGKAVAALSVPPIRQAARIIERDPPIRIGRFERRVLRNQIVSRAEYAQCRSPVRCE